MKRKRFSTEQIVAALIVLAGRARSPEQICVLPSYTFVGTAAAVMKAGYSPYLVDIDPATMALDPDALEKNPVLACASAVIVVAPYGRPVDARKWRELSETSGVPVIIDAAAGFDTYATRGAFVDSGVPATLSFHATKTFGTGEGGAVLCGDVALAAGCRRALNVGFRDDRTAAISGINGKLREYHAAVGLAELDRWDLKREAFLAVANHYAHAARRLGLANCILSESSWASSYVLFRAPDDRATLHVKIALENAGVDHRLWYGQGLHRHPAYAACPADSLPVTDTLAARIIGLPMSIDLGESEIVHIVSSIASALGNPDKPSSSVA